MRFLHLLASFDFFNEPLLLAVSDGATITPATREVASAAFAAARHAAKSAAADIDSASTSEAAEAASTALAALPTIWVATDEQPSGADGCARGPSWQVLARLQVIARAALGQAERAMCVEASALVSLGQGTAATPAAMSDVSPPKDAADAAAVATDRGLRALFGRMFDPPAADFDALLMLNSSALPKAHLSWIPAEGGAGNGGTLKVGGSKSASNVYANLRKGEIGRGIGDDDVAALVERLRDAYGSLALFFYDGHGGRAVAIKWRPAAFLPARLTAGTAPHRMLIRRMAPRDTQEGPDDDTSAALVDVSKPWALPNLPDILAGMVDLGGGLVKTVKLPRSCHGLSDA